VRAASSHRPAAVPLCRALSHGTQGSTGPGTSACCAQAVGARAAAGNASAGRWCAARRSRVCGVCLSPVLLRASPCFSVLPWRGVRWAWRGALLTCWVCVSGMYSGVCTGRASSSRCRASWRTRPSSRFALPVARFCRAHCSLLSRASVVRTVLATPALSVHAHHIPLPAAACAAAHTATRAAAHTATREGRESEAPAALQARCRPGRRACGSAYGCAQRDALPAQCGGAAVEGGCERGATGEERSCALCLRARGRGTEAGRAKAASIARTHPR